MFKELTDLITKTETIDHIGKIENIVGMSMEASGGRASIGDIAIFTMKTGRNRYRWKWWALRMTKYSLWPMKI